MGLFSRKDKAPKGGSSLTTSQSTASINSGNSRGIENRTPASSITPGTPSSPMSPVKLPKVDLPRPPDPQLDPTGYLRSLGAVRERSKIVTDRALRNELNHFDVDLDRFPDVVSFVSGLIKRDYTPPFNTIPGHGRYQHFCVGGRDRIAHLLSTWPENIDSTERCRRLIDLFLVSVLLDAGAGTQWSYKSADNGRIYRRSEGLAVASLEMFKAGLFSGNSANKAQVDKVGLQSLTLDKLEAGLQSRPGNELAGLEGRTELLIRLADALDEKKDYFGIDGRPGNMIGLYSQVSSKDLQADKLPDHLLSHPSTQASSMLIVPLPVLWNVLMNGLASIWPPSRTALNGVSLGDAWPCQAMPNSGTASWESILPFHKLTQWLTYSLMQPMQSLLNMYFAGTELLTGLPEYRNGGLFVDMGVLTVKPDDLERGLQNFTDYCRRTGTKGVEVAPMFEPGDDVVVEWRGVTVGFLDKLCVEVNKALKNELAGHDLTLPQLLEAGSWKGGREIAEINRPNTKEPPILIESDGTVF
ncbi:Uracil catabolism protein 4 [Tolypocladium paradoxum]|uniref:Uracil catabolism protein 4 n=1 Tax=Tolypocladium paradoxum TaxID=94208 RepID=A0A2S4KUD4_9HYPO|nr:Uracil catabolism protein 4 [Tolypocladium paradoxum]